MSGYTPTAGGSVQNHSSLQANGGSVLLTPTGVVVPILGGTDGAWQVRTPCQNVALANVGQVVSTVDVVIDPGHGGTETGAIAPNGLREADVNLAVAQRIQWWLQHFGISSVMTRTTDHRTSIMTRTEIARTLQPRVFVSVHHNGGSPGVSTTPGSDVFHQKDSADARRLAGLVLEELQRALSTYDIEWTSRATPGATSVLNAEGDDFYGILRRSQGVPAVLTEALYLTNPAEAAIVSTPQGQQVEAAAIGAAVRRYLISSDAGSGYVAPFSLRSAGGGGGLSGCIDPPLK